MSRKRLIPALGTALAAAAIMAPGAQADDSEGAMACVFVPGAVIGNYGSPGDQSIINDWNVGGGWDPLQLLDTEARTFNFAGPATCELLDAAGSSGPTQLTTTAQVNASGRAVNVICATGTANGSVNMSGFGLNLTAQFGITVVPGAGKVSFTNFTGSFLSDTVNGGEGTGVISLLPVEGDCVTHGPPGNVNRFLVNGGFQASLSGN